MDDVLRAHVRYLDHVAIAVRRIRDALPLYRDLLGGEYHQGGISSEGGFRWVQFTYPEKGKLELIEPLLVEHLKAQGLRIVGEDYRDPTWKEAFISPRSAHGTVIQLVESVLTEEEQVRTWHPDLETLLRSG